MKDVCIITYFAFWREGSGVCNRILSLVNYLSSHVKLKIIFAGIEQPKDALLLANINYQLTYLERKSELTREGYVERLSIVFKNYLPDVCIIEHLYLAFVGQYVPRGVKLFLDTHDLMSERGKTHNDLGYKHEQIELKDEIEIFRTYDKVILIQEEEYNKTSKYIGYDKTILAPHPVRFSKKEQKKKVFNLGFIGSDYLPNIDAIKWFIGNVFYRIKNPVDLHIFGKVCKHLKKYQKDNIILHGYVDSVEVVYMKADIMINPVRMGAGLKIKNVEALGNGMPLITTSHGASGLRNKINKSFLIADDADEFLKKLKSLIENHEKRKILGNNAYHYVEKKFSDSNCFASLIRAINE